MSDAPVWPAWLAAGTLALTVWAHPAADVEGRRTTPAQTRVNEDARLSAEFIARVQSYVALHQKADATLPEVSNSATSRQVQEHQLALARLMEQARRGAQPGDIFTRDVRAYFRRQIARALAGPDGKQLKSAIMEENPGPIKLRINGRYPDSVPVSTMPPQVLSVLPPLPPELEYRFLGARLILLDAHGHLVVDYIDDALPR